MGRLQKKTWARVDDGTPGDGKPLDEERWLELWAFGTGSAPAGLGLAGLDFWGLTPREFQALTKVWERGLEFQQSLYAEVYAGLRNMALGMGLKPPTGEFWTREMFLSGYQAPKREFDWQTQKELMKRVGKRPDKTQRKAEAEALASTRDRFRQADEAKKRGASREEIRLIMEA